MKQEQAREKGIPMSNDKRGQAEKKLYSKPLLRAVQRAKVESLRGV
jgi:hypothetical protein